MPDYLLPIVKQGHAHKSKFNENYKEKFIEWITQFEGEKNRVLSNPFLIEDIVEEDCKIKCSDLKKNWHDKD